MTIIHITSTLGGGGAEQMVLQLAKQSTPQFRTIVISLSGSRRTLEKHFKQHHIEYYILDVHSFKNKALFVGLKQFKDIIKDLKNVVIHCHMFYAGLFGILYKLRHPKVPIIFTLHSNVLIFKSQRIILFLTKFLRFKDIIFSLKGKKWYLKSNSQVISNGVSFKEFDFGQRSVPENEFRFLFIGRISHEKSPLRLVEAAKQLINKGVDKFCIDFVGDGILKDELENQIKLNGLELYFKLHGFQHDIKPFLRHANCMVLPSLWEGLPIVIIEAAAARLPIISTPVGSIPDFLNDSNAYLSSLEDFDTTMHNVMQNYNEAIKKSEILYDNIKTTFEIENVFNEHLKLYKSALN